MEHVQVVNHADQLDCRVSILEKEVLEAQNHADRVQSELSNQKDALGNVVDNAKDLNVCSYFLQSECQDAKNKGTHLQSELSVMTTKHHQAISKVNVLTHNNLILEAEVEGLRHREELRTQ